MNKLMLPLSLLLLAGCAAAPLLGLAADSAVAGVQAGLDEVNARLAAGDGQISSLSLADWGGVGGAVLAGITGLNAWRNKTRAKVLRGGAGK